MIKSQVPSSYTCPLHCLAVLLYKSPALSVCPGSKPKAWTRKLYMTSKDRIGRKLEVWTLLEKGRGRLGVGVAQQFRTCLLCAGPEFSPSTTRREKNKSQAWSHTPLILHLRARDRWISEFEATLLYMVTRSVRVAKWDPVSLNLPHPKNAEILIWMRIAVLGYSWQTSNKTREGNVFIIYFPLQKWILFLKTRSHLLVWNSQEIHLPLSPKY